MGSFSWEYAEKSDKQKNIACGSEFKFLVPEHLGGGSIDDNYRDYGYLGEVSEADKIEPNQLGKYDMYELQAIMNKDVRIADLLERHKDVREEAIERHPENDGLGDIALEREIFSITGLSPEYLEDERKILDQNPEATVGDLLKGNLNDFPKKIDENTDHNRCIGIELACYDGEGALLDYPLKLVRPSYQGTYEECKDYSKGDPKQGFFITKNTNTEIKKWEKENSEYVKKYLGDKSIEKD